MLQAARFSDQIANRHFKRSTGSGLMRWRTQFFGAHKVTGIGDDPQAFLVEMSPNGSTRPHFHHVDEYQIIVAGSGSLGRSPISSITLHYVDHHTAYGPIIAGPFGMSFFTIRAKSDPGGIFLHKPDYKDFLKPTKKRYLLAQNIPLSTDPALEHRTEAFLENVFTEEADYSDGLGAFMLRLGGNMTAIGPDPRTTGGQFCLVVNGSLQLDSGSYPAWSVVRVDSTEASLELRSGPQGVEALILNFAREENYNLA